PTQVVAVDFRHHDVHEDAVGPPDGDVTEGLGAGAVDGDGMPSLLEEGLGDVGLDGAVVHDVDIERPAHALSSKELPADAHGTGWARASQGAACSLPRALRGPRTSVIMAP